MQKFRPQEGESSFPVLKIKELRQGYCDIYSDRCSAKINSKYLIHPGDVVFSWSGSLIIGFWCGEISGLNQHLFKVTSDEYDKWYYYAWTSYYLKEFITIANDMATTMGHIRRSDLAEAKVLIPSKSDYKKIGSLISPLYDLIILNKIENQRLSSLRDELLTKLISGEINITETNS